MKVCYCDESGTGSEPIAVTVGVIVDSQRMHVTKKDWEELLERLSGLTGRKLQELHTRDFYAGNGVWRDMKGEARSSVITEVFNWLQARKHDVVFVGAVKELYHAALQKGEVPPELNTVWRFLGFHLVLAVQKAHQRHEKNKGNTIFIFDNEEREETRFTEAVVAPPQWSDEYYGRGKKQQALDQVIDVPYFADSRGVVMIQVADFIAYFLRRYTEISENLTPPRYPAEMPKVEGWVKLLAERSIGRSMTYPAKGRCRAAEIYYQLAPRSIREL